MSALLSVIEGNPRGRRRRRKSRRTRSTKARKTTRRRRARSRLSNPVHHRRRRRVGARRRRANPRRRRHHNPIMGGGLVGTLVKGVTLGVGAVAANAATAAVNHFAFNGTMNGPTKIALKAGVGVAGFMAIKSVLKKPGLANSFLLGAGIAVALDIYDQFVKPTIAGNAATSWLADYDYGTLSGWAPQAGVSGWAPQAGVGAYSQGLLSGDGDAYANGAYN